MKDLKVGDTIEIPYVVDSDQYFQSTIIGMTKTWYVDDFGREIRKSDLKIIGSRHRYARIPK